MTIEETLARLEALCARTDRGPWEAMHDWRVEDSTERPYALVFARVLDEDGTTGDIDIARCFRRQCAEWIVEAHTAMPALLAIARAAQRALGIVESSLYPVWHAGMTYDDGTMVGRALQGLADALAALGRAGEGGEGAG